MFRNVPNIFKHWCMLLLDHLIEHLQQPLIVGSLPILIMRNWSGKNLIRRTWQSILEEVAKLVITTTEAAAVITRRMSSAVLLGFWIQKSNYIFQSERQRSWVWLNYNVKLALVQILHLDLIKKIIEKCLLRGAGWSLHHVVKYILFHRSFFFLPVYSYLMFFL